MSIKELKDNIADIKAAIEASKEANDTSSVELLEGTLSEMEAELASLTAKKTPAAKGGSRKPKAKKSVKKPAESKPKKPMSERMQKLDELAKKISKEEGIGYMAARAKAAKSMKETPAPVGMPVNTLANFKRKYEENEDRNHHSDNVVLLAETFGTKDDIKEAKDILAEHRKEGHLTDSLNERSYSLHKKLWAIYKKKSSGGSKSKEKTEAVKSRAAALKGKMKARKEKKSYRSNKDLDGMRSAKRAGKRISKDGNVYYEYRDNRSDSNVGRKSYRKPKLFAKGGEVRYKVKGDDPEVKIENSQKVKSLIEKVYETQEVKEGDSKYPLNFIKETLFTGEIVKHNGKHYLKGTSDSLSHLSFLDNKYFLEALAYIDRPTIKEYAKGGHFNRSWSQDHFRVNKEEGYESQKPTRYSKRAHNR